MPDRTQYYKVTVILLIIVLSILVYFQFKHYYCHHKYTFISNECSDLVISKKGYVGLKDNLEKYFEKQKADGKLLEVSVYFRDLNNGPVMGINEMETFSSASLLKLPIVMGVLKMAEDTPEIMDIKMVNEGETNSAVNQFFVPDKKIERNVAYSIQDLIYYALSYSDNTAIKMLYEFMDIKKNDTDNLPAVFKDLGLTLPTDLEDRDISTRSYSSLYRLLYNSSYLNSEYSDMVLEYLKGSHFTRGLTAGVPENIVVAHKFGERYIGDIKQLHDCGIVYYPNNPYLLCVMTQGENWDELADTIKTVSSKVYIEVDSRKL